MTGKHIFQMFGIVIIIRRHLPPSSSSSFIRRSHHKTVRFWSRAVGSHVVLLWLAFVQMLTDNHFNASSVVSSKLLIYFYVEGKVVLMKLQFRSPYTRGSIREVPP